MFTKRKGWGQRAEHRFPAAAGNTSTGRAEGSVTAHVCDAGHGHWSGVTNTFQQVGKLAIWNLRVTRLKYPRKLLMVSLANEVLFAAGTAHSFAPATWHEVSGKDTKDREGRTSCSHSKPFALPVSTRGPIHEKSRDVSKSTWWEEVRACVLLGNQHRSSP